jgi:glycosyltransferase involved in cell wall biosynthesis
MKLAQIVCTYPPYRGGIGNSALGFAQLLERRGVKVTTFTPNYQEAKTKQEYVDGTKVVRLKPWLQYGNGAVIPGLYSEIKNYNRILLHYPFFGGGEIIWLFKLWTKTNTPLIIHYHMDVGGLSLPAKILSLPSTLISGSLFKRAEAITCASLDYVKNSKIKNLYQKHPDKFIEIPFGVDNDRFYPQGIKKASPVKLLFVGGLDKAHYFKGLTVLLKALTRLNKNSCLPKWELDIVGEGELQDSYKGQARKLGIEDKVNFRGGVGDLGLVRAYQESDVLILPSINKGEAFGLVLLEAMACGTPVIASDLPGVRNVFENHKQGLLTSPGDDEDVASKIEDLLLNKKKRKEMGEKAAELVRHKYSREKTGDKLEKVITGKYFKK